MSEVERYEQLKAKIHRLIAMVDQAKTEEYDKATVLRTMLLANLTDHAA